METAGCYNAIPLVAMLHAEAQARRVRDDKASLLAAYGRGIDYLAEHGLLPFEASLNDQAGFECARRGWRTEADDYFKEALHIYKHRWGAKAKYSWLVEKSEHALEHQLTKEDADESGPKGTCVPIAQRGQE